MTTLDDLEIVVGHLRSSFSYMLMASELDGLAGNIADYIAAQRERDAGGWQPIETAPESSLVILFCDARGNRWTDCADNRHEVCGFPATHWMPLPPPPTTTTEENANG